MYQFQADMQRESWAMVFVNVISAFDQADRSFLDNGAGNLLVDAGLEPGIAACVSESLRWTWLTTGGVGCIQRTT